MILTAAVAAGLAVFAWHRRTISGAVPFLLLMLAVAAWSLGYAAELVAGGLEAKLFWAKVQYPAIVSVPYVWLIFALQYTGHAWRLNRRWLLVLALMPALTVALVWTNELHGLIWSSQALDIRAGHPALDVTYGPWFWGHTFYSYLLTLAGTLLLGQFFAAAQGIYRRQAGMVLLAALFPWIGNAIYIFDLNPFPGLDFTAFAFMLTGLLSGWAFMRLQFLDIVPLARDTVLESLQDGVFVLDAQHRMLDFNPAAERMVQRPLARLLGQRADQVFAEYPELVSRFIDRKEAHEILTGGDGDHPQYFDLIISPLWDRRMNFAGRAIVIRDITERQLARLALQRSHDELELCVQERTAELVAANDKLQLEIAERRQIEAALRERVAVERFVSGISTHFINLASDEIDQEIHRALRMIGEFARVDRCYIYRLADDRSVFENTHEWCAAGIPAQIDRRKGLSCALFPWWMEHLEGGDVIHIPKIADVPPEAHLERKFLEESQVQSFVVVPLVYGKSLFGFFGFDSARQEKTWAEEEILLLRQVGEIFTNAFARLQAEALLVRRNEALRASEAELRAVFAAMSDLVLVLDREGCILRVAPTQPESTFGPAEVVAGKSLGQLLPSGTAEELCQAIRAALAGRKTVQLDFSVVADGRRAWFAAAISPVDDGRVVLVARDITGRKASEEEFIHKAMHDALTGLPNRRLFRVRLEQAFQRARRHPDELTAVLFLDLDQFKTINDSYGHAFGDRFLAQVAERLQACMRASDTVARFGGDEFAILLEEIGQIGEAIQVAERVQQELALLFELDGQALNTSASIGIALASQDYREPAEVLRDADVAMYRAKMKGKGCYELFERVAEKVGI
jgi:diguanylate cyclase (GGDEF)-like protein/PAS domain S-box-containing protein